MASSIIEINGLSKKYRIMQQKERYLALRDTLTNSFKKPLEFLRGKRKFVSSKEDFWALKDISFDVKQGEVVGIIGKNGAGKTTLLKILSRITWPTKGEIRLRGRVSSLLEVGTGFHPELTGRENIYFNGSILGMSKREIDKKFDEMVAFAEVEKFIDTPVKRYSSGMQVRLAFAVAAHLEPEILIIDEVLSVGDLAFQKKSLGKMENVASEGRTVLFVSHNMGAVQRLCPRTILLQEGKLIMDGPSDKVIVKYTESGGSAQCGEQIWQDISKAPGNDIVRINSVRVLDRHGNVNIHFDVRDSVMIEIQYWVLQDLESQCVAVYFNDEMGRVIFVSRDNVDSPWKDTANPKGLYRSICNIPGDLLNHGMVSVTVVVETMDAIRRYPRPLVKDALVFHIGDRMNPEGVRGNYPTEWESYAVVRPRLHWKVKHISKDIPGS